MFLFGVEGEKLSENEHQCVGGDVPFGASTVLPECFRGGSSMLSYHQLWESDTSWKEF